MAEGGSLWSFASRALFKDCTASGLEFFPGKEFSSVDTLASLHPFNKQSFINHDSGAHQFEATFSSTGYQPCPWSNLSLLKSTGCISITELLGAIQSIMGNEKKAPGSFLCDCLIKAFKAGLCLRSSEAAQGTSILQALPHTVISVSLFSKSSFFLFCFPFRGPASLHPVSFSFLSPYAYQSFQSFRWPGSWLRDLGRAWRRCPPSPTFSAPLLAPSTDLGPSGFLLHLPPVGTILCARPRLAAHLLGQVRGIEVGSRRALTERGSCLSPLF